MRVGLYLGRAQPTFLAGMLACDAVRRTQQISLIPPAGSGVQVVRLDGPPKHLLLKSGTPTMGGISFVPVGAILAVFLTSAEPTVLGDFLQTLKH